MKKQLLAQQEEKKEHKKKTWMDLKHNGTKDPEINKIRKNMKNGILAYDKYMRDQGKLVQEGADVRIPG